jgi:2-dehydropantoate 2-reductase
MQAIRTVAVFGAGALGVMYAQPLAKLLGEGLFFVADGDRYERLRAATFLVNGAEERFAVRKPDQLDSPADLVLVAVKNYDLPLLSPAISRISGPGTIVVSVLNGIDSEALLERAVPGSTVLHCCVLGMDAVKEGPAVRFSTRGKILLGAADNRPSAALSSAVDLFRAAGLVCETPADIRRSIWWKWMINIGVNQVSAVTGATYGVFHEDRDIQLLMEAAMREVIALARAEGVDLSEQDIEAWYPVLRSLGAAGKTSMLQDVEAGRKTEVASFAGRLVELSAARGLSAPVNETLLRIIAVREKLGLTI